MAQQKNSNYEQFYLVEDGRIRESFRVIYDNTENLQTQFDRLVELITNATDLANLQSTVQSEFS
jgi:hypothetical protein